ncbi:unnamed protein product [Durusdinium trenchii]|uniref:J domain-containing protein n=1 Tax=Durusdinium trenchii TaxID=1381693 RepID=A0ABP0MV63_9DINO
MTPATPANARALAQAAVANIRATTAQALAQEKQSQAPAAALLEPATKKEAKTSGYERPTTLTEAERAVLGPENVGLDEEDEEDQHEEKHEVFLADPRPEEAGRHLLDPLLLALLRAPQVHAQPALAAALGFFGMELVVELVEESLGAGEEGLRTPGSGVRLSAQLRTELQTSEAALRGATTSSAEEVVALQAWRGGALLRLRELERQVAWRVLGIPRRTADISAIGKAFKRRALQLHPDKGGDQLQFQLLQEMKGLLMPEPRTSSSARRSASREREGEDTDEEIEELLRARRRLEEPEEPVELKADLSVTRLKLHRAVLEIWERSKRLEAQLGALNGAAPSGSGGEGDVTDEESVQDILQQLGALSAHSAERTGAAALAAPATLTRGQLERLKELASKVASFMTPSAPDGRDSLDALAPVRGERPPRCSAQAEEEVLQVHRAVREEVAAVAGGPAGAAGAASAGYKAGAHHGAGCVCTMCLRRRWGFRS